MTISRGPRLISDDLGMIEDTPKASRTWKMSRRIYRSFDLEETKALGHVVAVDHKL